LGDLLDEAAQRGQGACASIIASGWLGLLPELLGVQQQGLVFDLEIGSLTVLDQGDVLHLSDGISPLGRRFICALAQGPRTKEQLTTTVWQQSYHPLRHDSVIYSMVAKIRRTLGSRSHWLLVTDDGYGLVPGVRVIEIVESKSSPDSVRLAPGPQANLPPLNSRQLAILRAVRAGEFFDVRRGINELGASDATISRDLAKMVELGLLARMGRGRATSYKAVNKDSVN